MHILFLSHYYPPESNAPANRVSELAREWVSSGHRVTVVTTAPSHPGGRCYPGYRNRIFQKERLDGVEVIRLGTFLAENKGVALRSLNYISFLISAMLQAPRLPRADVIVSTSPQFFAGLAGAAVASIMRRPWVFEVRDIWPESVAAVAALKKGAAIGVLERLERWAYRRADQIVVVSPAFKPHIEDRGPLRRPIDVVENGADLELFSAPSDADAFRSAHGLSGKIVFGYIGTHGMAHGLETILKAAVRTRDDPDIAYLMVGSGARRAELLEMRDRLELANVVMLDHQPRSAMPAIWSAIDVSLVHLRRSPLFHRVIPSKIFEAMAMRRPILLGVDGMAREIVQRGDCGVYAEPEDAAVMAATVGRLAADPELRRRLGDNGLRFVREHYDRRVLATRYLEALRVLAGLGPEPIGGNAAAQGTKGASASARVSAVARPRS